MVSDQTDPLMIFTLNNILQNNTSVFATFIDLKKTFVFVDRDMLLYKLLVSNINGKLYDSLKNIYAHQLFAHVSMKSTQTDSAASLE